MADEQASRQKHQSRPATQKRTPTSPPEPAGTASTGIKLVAYRSKDVATINAKLRFTTLVILPPGERILDFVCGDKEFWVINGSENLAYVKPAKPGSQTNLNLITESGNIYSFLLNEVSDVPNATPDLKVFVEFQDDAMTATLGSPPVFVSRHQLDDYRQQLELAKEETRQVKVASEAAIDAGVTKFITNVRFPYRFEAGKKPFYVRAMYHDDNLTYLQARPEETPTLYEIRDGKPNLVNFQYRDGIYVVDKILDSGYLAIGKARLRFTREE
ncbi:MAG TPA: TrbG/VirB9 family P-type conjugative transfer protein [Vicinamibacterales bacterium]|nr:TrbG/VirB9 family P-type conjugative transfer protein [Vicinamibacterales bacterium]